jgi:short-subunit dehydrogenase
MKVSGAIVIITGASSGIGAATARAFASAGATVVLAARSAGPLEQLAADLPGNPLAIPTDLGNEAEACRLVERTVAERGRLDVLINNAGVGLSEPVETLATADLERTLAVNLVGPLATIQAAVPHMRQRGSGHIINVSSVLGCYPLPYAGGYAASKAALDRLTEALRMELRGSGIAVTLLRPGTTKTDFHKNRLGHNRAKRQADPPAATPEAVAQSLLGVVRRPRRVAYVTLRDRLQVLAARLAPALADRILTKMFTWEQT